MPLPTLMLTFTQYLFTKRDLGSDLPKSELADNLAGSAKLKRNEQIIWAAKGIQHDISR